jgi:hypothetical protein
LPSQIQKIKLFLFHHIELILEQHLNMSSDSIQKLQALSQKVAEIRLKPGNKKNSALMRKHLMEIKNLSHSMRAEALGVAKQPREAKIVVDAATLRPRANESDDEDTGPLPEPPVLMREVTVSQRKKVKSPPKKQKRASPA